MADATDLKSVGLLKARAGSSPAIGTFDFGTRISERAERSIRTKWEIADMNARPLFIPVILGTARQGRQSENVGRFVFEETKKRADVETELIDVRELPIETR